MLATNSFNPQAVAADLMKRIPERKRMKPKNPERLPSRAKGHTLYGKPEDWTRFQKGILKSVWRERLVFFDGKSDRQEELLEWAEEESKKSGRPEDVLTRDHIKVKRPHGNPNDISIIVRSDGKILPSQNEWP